VLLIGRLTGMSFIVGALLSRFAGIAAGRFSLRDPQALFGIPRRHRSNFVTIPEEDSIDVSERAGQARLSP
jgi:hypothetical protein